MLVSLGGKHLSAQRISIAQIDQVFVVASIE